MWDFGRVVISGGVGPGNKDWRALAALVLGLLSFSAEVARAEGVESFVVGGVGFRVPAGFVVAPTGASRSVMLRFHLPDFGVVDDRAFVGVYPGDDRPVLTVEISDDVSVPVGQVWLDQEIAYADAVKASCWHCENDFSALGALSMIPSMGSGCLRTDRNCRPGDCFGYLSIRIPAAVSRSVFLRLMVREKDVNLENGLRVRYLFTFGFRLNFCLRGWCSWITSTPG